MGENVWTVMDTEQGNIAKTAKKTPIRQRYQTSKGELHVLTASVILQVSIFLYLPIQIITKNYIVPLTIYIKYSSNINSIYRISSTAMCK